MSDDTKRVEGRVNKREFISRVGRRAGVPIRVASQVYDSMIEELLTILENGDRLTLTGFGKFYPQEHKGHQVRVRFAENGGDSAEIDNYAVLKFSATREVNKRIGAGAFARRT